MKKLLDKWEYKAKDHTTYYYLFNDGHNYDICVSKAVYKNKPTTYVMSDTRDEWKTYGSQEQIKAIIKELERGIN